MGFDKYQVKELFDSEGRNIDDANHAVELLLKGENGYIHKYVEYNERCRICGEGRLEHV
jgi:hypothetical protein